MSNVSKYLSQYAEPEVKLLANFPTLERYAHVVVIPVYKERDDFIRCFLASSLAQQNVLLVVVINQPSTEQNAEPQKQLYQQLRSLGQLKWQNANLSYLTFTDGNCGCLLVDRFTQPIDEKQGVGLARKIGADLACQLMAQGNITSDWLHSTDADASLPSTYFDALTDNLSEHGAQQAVGACYNFYHHSDDPDIHLANSIYESSLRYYVAGLSYAKSPYNFFTIGSVLAFTLNGYASVRGFPKKSAGEDFYLLNKLAKIGNILWIKQCIIALEARASDRVPFGTGPAVAQILTLNADNQAFSYYHPQVFVQLKTLLAHFHLLYDARNELMAWYQELNEDIVLALKALGFENFVTKQQGVNQTQFNKQLVTWFDAFKTLKFIHYLRDHYYANIPLTQAIAMAEFEVELIDKP